MNAVVIPCYKVSSQICALLQEIGSDIEIIFVVDDCCPEKSGALVERNCHDPRVNVIYHTANQGVGGAVLTGYQAAIKAGAQIIVKIDGDGQMDPGLIPAFIAPIVEGDADYTKGNRFFDLEGLSSMPKLRILGNAILSFMTKFSSGYWDLFDPTNGYTAIHSNVAQYLPFKKISYRYFFETDMLFRLNTLRAVVLDIPMDAKYGDEKSNLKVSKILFEFTYKHAHNFLKRIFYNYYLRDMSIVSIELPLGALLFVFGGVFGIYHWGNSLQNGVETTSGTVMLAALPILIGGQLMLSFLSYDIANVPRRPLHKLRKGHKISNLTEQLDEK